PGRAGKGGAGAAASGAGIHNAFRLDVSGSTFERNVATAGNSKAASVSSGGSGQDGPPGGDSFGGGIANFATAFVVNSTFSTNKVFGGSGGNGGTGDIGSGDGGNGGSGYGGSFYNNITAGLTK